MIEWLWDSGDALTYLQGRGLLQNTIAEAKLGYVPPGGDSRFAHCIAIPYHDAQGRWRLTRYRHLRPNHPQKYDAPKHSSRHIYGVAQVREPVVYITEGEFDALILRQMGKASVAIPGAQSWDRAWRWLFRDCDLVVVLMDNDEEGRKASRRVASQIGTVTDVMVLDLPQDMDVTDLYLTNPDELRRLLA